jgi:hypothetical protein
MNKTGYQVAGDVYQFVRGSALAEAVNGGVYHAGTRPRDSRKEDIVIGFVAGAPADLQELVVNVNVFVPDVDPWNNGVLTPNVARLTELEGIAAEWANSLTVATTGGNYKVSLYDNIHTSEAREMHEHFVNVPLRLEYWSNYE